MEKASQALIGAGFNRLHAFWAYCSLYYDLLFPTGCVTDSGTLRPPNNPLRDINPCHLSTYLPPAIHLHHPCLCTHRPATRHKYRTSTIHLPFHPPAYKVAVWYGIRKIKWKTRYRNHRKTGIPDEISSSAITYPVISLLKYWY